MGRLTENLDIITDRIRESFAAKDAAREKVLPICREVIRFSSLSIRALHRQELDKADELQQSARKLLDDAEQVLASGVDIRTVFLIDAQKEYAEGRITLALVRGQLPPTPEELKVDPVAFLHGLAEAVGELRRYLLDCMRKGDLSRGEEFLSDMDDIYNVLVTMDFPDAITHGLRRTTDNMRGVLEKTRSDLTLTIRQKALEDRLK
ncbi:MAG: haloacid dehalogenase [Dehalococcoidales bacterium]|nr:haloacid dehalogenase [Dehalococcoidales bacterium]